MKTPFHIISLAAALLLCPERGRGEEAQVTVPLPDASATPMPGSGFALPGHEFAWIQDGASGFWITKEEIGGQATAPSTTVLRREIEGLGIPASWTVSLPTAAQWRAAQGRAQDLGLADFEGGLGEFLSDGKIIGVSSFTSDPKSKGPLSKNERQKLTRRMISPGKAANPRRSAAVPPTYASAENVFAYRIVIVPPAGSE